MINQTIGQLVPAALAFAPEGLTNPETAEQLQQFGRNVVAVARARGVGALQP